MDLSCGVGLSLVLVRCCQTETWLDGDILHPTTRPPESGATANSTGLGAETFYISLDRVNQQVGAVSEATTADC